MNEKIPDELYKSNESETKSLDLLHEGQKAALENNLEIARDKIIQSLDIAKNGDDNEWIAYLEGTIAYINSDLDKLNSFVDSAGSNSAILSNLANGLKDRGQANYKEDYHN